MKTSTSVNRVACNELTSLFTKVSKHEFVLKRTFGHGSAKIFNPENGLQVCLWNFCFEKETELYNNSETANGATFYTLTFFLNTEGLQIAQRGKLLSLNTIWDTFLICNASTYKIFMAPTAKCHCLSISFSMRWLQNRVFCSDNDFVLIEETCNNIKSLVIHESMSVADKNRLTEFMAAIRQSPLGSFYIKSHALVFISNFFQRLREMNLDKHSRNSSIEELERYLCDNLKGPLPPLRHLTSRFSVSPSTLSRHFNKVYGVNISTYFMRQKIEYAHKLMNVEGKSLAEVATLLGYAKVNTLKAMYKKYRLLM